MIANSLDSRGAAFGFAHHAQQPGLLEHVTSELIHAGGRGRSGGADNFAAHRIDRANVVDEAIGEIDRRLLALASMSVMRLCAASRPVSSLPLSSSTSPSFQVATSSRVTVSRFTRRAPEPDVGNLGPIGERRRLECDRAGAVEHEVRVARGGAVGNHRDRKIGGVGGIVLHLHVENGG